MRFLSVSRHVCSNPPPNTHLALIWELINMFYKTRTHRLQAWIYPVDLHLVSKSICSWGKVVLRHRPRSIVPHPHLRPSFIYLSYFLTSIWGNACTWILEYVMFYSLKVTFIFPPQSDSILVQKYPPRWSFIFILIIKYVIPLLIDDKSDKLLPDNI